METIYALAEHQFGAVSRAQALECGLTEDQIERRIRHGHLVRMFPGTYRVAGAPTTGRQRAMAATLWLGDESAVSHLTAGTLLRLDGCRTSELHVSAPDSVRRRSGRDDICVHKVSALDRIDRVVVDGIPCTSATRTILDCGRALSSEALEAAFESARRMGLTSVRSLRQRASALGTDGRRASKSVNDLLKQVQPNDAAAQFRLEVKMARLLRAGTLPRPVRQLAVGPYRIDFAYPAAMLGIECEGWEFHGNRLAWKRDKARTAWLEAHGWRIMFVTWDDVTREPRQTLDRLVIALGFAAE